MMEFGSARREIWLRDRVVPVVEIGLQDREVHKSKCNEVWRLSRKES